MIVLAGVVLLLVLIASGVGGPWTVTDRLGLVFGTPEAAAPTPRPINNPFGTPTPPAADGRPPLDLSWLDNVLLTLAIAAGVVAIGIVVWMIWRRFRALQPDPEDEPVPTGTAVAGDVPAEPELPALRRGVAAARDLLDRIADPDDAIIRAWLAVEEAAAESGVTRNPAETPTEFTVAVLDRTPADPAAVRRLLGLYLRARFATEPASSGDVREAKRCLFALAERWAEADHAVDRISRGGEPEVGQHKEGEVDDRP